MPPIVASCIFAAFIGWLFLLDFRRRPAVSKGLWVPTLWMGILGSRFVSVWIGTGGATSSSDGYSEGSPLDRLVFLALIVAGCAILARRGVSLGVFLRRNKWLAFYFIYIGISVLWSDATFVSLKRWIKDVGNIVMVLVILTEGDPIGAVRSLFARFACFAVPMSVLFNKYYPHLSRYYDLWTYQPFFAGVTTDKNLLGMTLYVSGVYLCWETMTLRKEIGRKLSLKDWFAQLLMISMTVWLLSKAHSSTALACTVLGSALMLAFRIPFVRRASGRLSIYGVAGALLLAGLNSAFDLDEKIVRLLGRDMTFTGRTEIWQAVLDENTNPIFGCGFYSFWSEKRVERLSEDHYFHLNSAHNAYLETYLNTGAIGLLLLIGVFGHSIFRISEEVKRGSSYAAFRLAVVFSIATYGMTEAIFNRLGPIWMLLLLVVIEYRQPQRLGPAADVAAY